MQGFLVSLTNPKMKDPDHIRWTNRGIGSLFVAAGGALALFKRG